MRILYVKDIVTFFSFRCPEFHHFNQVSIQIVKWLANIVFMILIII